MAPLCGCVSREHLTPHEAAHLSGRVVQEVLKFAACCSTKNFCLLRAHLPASCDAPAAGLSGDAFLTSLQSAHLPQQRRTPAFLVTPPKGCFCSIEFLCTPVTLLCPC